MIAKGLYFGLGFALVVNSAAAQVALPDRSAVSRTVWDEQIPFIVETTDPVTLTTGAVKMGEPFITIPFAYAAPVRLKNDVRTMLHTIRAGAVGFEVGDFDTITGRQHVTCLFRAEGENPYAVPECVRYEAVLGIWATAQVSDNLPLQMEKGSPVFGKLEYETAGVTIDHRFAVQVRVKSWGKKTIRLDALSEGKSVFWAEKLIGDDGSVRLDVGTGTIVLRRASDDKQVDVTFLPVF